MAEEEARSSFGPCAPGPGGRARVARAARGRGIFANVISLRRIFNAAVAANNYATRIGTTGVTRARIRNSLGGKQERGKYAED